MEMNKLIQHLRFCGDLEANCRECERYYEMGADGGTASCVNDLMQKAADALAEQQKRIAELEAQNRWIPVTEWLPEDDDRLTFYDDGRMRCTTVLSYTIFGRIIPKNRLKVRVVGNDYLDTQATDGWVWGSGSEDATHWAPMPEPPKEGA